MLILWGLKEQFTHPLLLRKFNSTYKLSTGFSFVGRLDGISSITNNIRLPLKQLRSNLCGTQKPSITH